MLKKHSRNPEWAESLPSGRQARALASGRGLSGDAAFCTALVQKEELA
jgi:hypothetical protein